MKKEIDELSLEQALKELEQIAQKMEDGGISLEKTVSLYERGMALSAHCKAQREGFERRIHVLQEGEETPFEL